MTNFDIEWSNRHDKWNIVWLPIVFLTNIYMLFNWTPLNEQFFIIIFLLYLITDLIWLIIKPCSVANPAVIYLHHMVSIIGVIIIPQLDEELRHIIFISTLTEINTWVRLIRNNTTGYINFALDILFLLSWLIIRCIIGPYISILIWNKWNKHNNDTYKIMFNTSIVLNTLTAVWTYQLVRTVKIKIRKYYETNEVSQ